MTPCEPRDVILVHFPFTSLRASKKRPAVVISKPDFSERNGDVVLMALTGVNQVDAPALEDWKAAGLIKPTWVTPLLATLDREIVERRLGRLSSRDCRKVAEALRPAIAGEFLHR
jgi:mRNA interferase MazF